MKTLKFNFKSIVLTLVVVLSFSSCQEEVNTFKYVESIPCDNPNEVALPNIITDFECQANAVLNNVEAVFNPDWSGANQSRFVGKYIDPAAPWDALIIDYGAPIDLSTFNTFKIKIKTHVEGLLKVKLEGGSSTPIEIDNNITNTSDWVEYSFDFSDQFNQSHNKIVIFFNAGNDTNGSDEYYIDDLRFEPTADLCNGVVPDLSIVNDFDCQQNQDIPEVETTATPFKSSVNSSKFSGKYIDELGAWDAVIIDYGQPIDLTTQNVFSIKVNAPVTGTLKIKLEGGTSTPIEKDAEITKTGEWIEYTYDFSSQALENHAKIILFFNVGVDTDGTDVYYMDDLKFTELTDPCSGVNPDLTVMNDFNCQQNTTIPGFLVNEIVDNPMVNSNNQSDAVLKVTDDGTNPWDALVFDFGGPIDLSTNNILKIKILSTRAVPLLAKLEGGTSPAKEVWGTIDVVGDWTEYSFDFSDQATENQNKLTLFFNGGQNDGTIADEYYIDDIQFKEKVIIPSATFSMDFENNYTDAISSTDATIVGTPDFAGVGVHGTDAYAGATDSYLSFPTTGLKSPEFSATMWYKLNDSPDRAGILVMSPEDTNNANYPSIQNLRTSGFRFFREVGDNGNQRFKLNLGDGTADIWVDGGTTADVDPTTGNWINLAITISATEASVYIDGVLVGQSTFSGIDWTGCDVLSIMSGAPRFTEWGHLSDSSYLDDLKLYDVALSQDQIKQIMGN